MRKNNPFDNNPKPLFERFNLKDEIVKYTQNWYWFLLCILLFFAVSYVYIRYKVPLYNVTGTISISQEKNINDSALSAFKDLGVMDELKDELGSEIHLIRSKTLITNVVNKHKLNIQYFTEGTILESESYPKSAVEINFISQDSVVSNSYYDIKILINSKTNFTILDEDGKPVSKHSFGEKISSYVGDFIITPNQNFIQSSLGKTTKIQLSPVRSVVSSIRDRLAVYEIMEGTGVLNISLTDPVMHKAADIVNSLIDEYRNETIKHKKEVSKKTATFINDRIDLISNDLTEVDNEAAGYKSKFGLTNNLDAQTQQVASFDSQTEQQISELNTQIRLIESMQNFIQSQDGKYNSIPSNLGFDDANISSNVARYNSLIFQRKRLLKNSSELNPVVVNIDEQLNTIRQVLSSSLGSLKSNVNIQLNSLRTQEKYFSGKLYVAPTRQKDLRVIEREQTIKEQLYLYLLQKREEAQITNHVTIPNSRIIDRASALGAVLVSPKQRIIYLGALSLGFLIPFMFIYLKDLLNTKLRSKVELEKYTNLPILGTIPKSKNKFKKNNSIVINSKSRSPISEAFRILRTNLDFMMAGSKKVNPKIIFVTSSISGEGKTFISSNLAKTLAIYGSKVVYVGTDLRYPRFHEFLDLPKGKDTEGLTNYIMDSNKKPQDVVYKGKGEDSFSIVPPGSIPPNPSGLLSQDRVGELFKYLEQNFDYVVVDTAPSTLVTDTILISKYADLTIYVVRENYTDRRLLTYPTKFNNARQLKNVSLLLNSAEYGMETYGYGY